MTSPGVVTTRVPEEVAIRPAERADLLEVHRIERASFPQPWPYQAFAGFLAEPGFLVAVGDQVAGDAGTVGEGDVRGFVVADVVSEFGRTVGHVKDLAVAPEWRGRGIGSRLLERALSVLVAGGAGRAKLEVRESNEGAKELYARFGFGPNHVVPGYYEDGEDALVLVADLAGPGKR